jgi:hypothetical protein
MISIWVEHLGLIDRAPICRVSLRVSLMPMYNTYGGLHVHKTNSLESHQKMLNRTPHSHLNAIPCKTFIIMLPRSFQISIHLRHQQSSPRTPSYSFR